MMQSLHPLPARLADLPDSFVVTLPSFASVKVEGEDAKKFLHSQLTIDVNKLDDFKARRTAHCDFKGKSWSVGLLANTGSALHLLAEKQALNASIEQLKKYGVFSKITITPQHDDFKYFLVAGDNAAKLLTSEFSVIPDNAMGVSGSDDGFCIALDLPQNTLLVVMREENAETFSQQLQASGIAVYEEAVAQALNIAAGVPGITQADHINQYVPQMMNLQALNAIDFNKGCYMGQEVVARTRYLGKNKRAAMVFKLPVAITPSDDISLEKQAGEHWRSGGTILRLAVLGEETWLLAIVNNDTTAQDMFRLSSFTDAELIHCHLPYTLEQ